MTRTRTIYSCSEKPFQVCNLTRYFLCGFFNWRQIFFFFFWGGKIKLRSRFIFTKRELKFRWWFLFLDKQGFEFTIFQVLFCVLVHLFCRTSKNFLNRSKFRQNICCNMECGRKIASFWYKSRWFSPERWTVRYLRSRVRWYHIISKTCITANILMFIS